MSKAVAALLTVLALALAVTACGGSDESADDLLASIEDKGVLTVSTDPAYPPQSELNKETGEYEGFDIDVAKEIAERLEVDIAWEAPAWETIISGSWNGRWDISVGSMTITPERAEVLHFTPPYYFTPAAYAVHEDNTTITDVAGLAREDDRRLRRLHVRPLPPGQAQHRRGRVGRAGEDRVHGHRPRDQDVRHGLDRDPGSRAR